MFGLPPAGTPGVRDSRNPTLVPNFDKSVSTGSTIDHESPATYLANNPRVNATETVTIGGSPTENDTVALTFTHALLPTGAVTLTYTVLAGDTVIADVVEGIASLINASTALNPFEIYATASDDVITVNWPGPVGNFCTLTYTLSEGASETVTLGNSGVFANGSGPIFATNNFNFSPTGSSQPSSYFYGNPYSIGYDVITQMVAQGMPIA